MKKGEVRRLRMLFAPQTPLLVVEQDFQNPQLVNKILRGSVSLFKDAPGMHQFSSILKAVQLHNKFYRSTFVPPTISVTPTNSKNLVT